MGAVRRVINIPLSYVRHFDYKSYAENHGFEFIYCTFMVWYMGSICYMDVANINDPTFIIVWTKLSFTFLAIATGLMNYLHNKSTNCLLMCIYTLLQLSLLGIAFEFGYYKDRNVIYLATLFFNLPFYVISKFRTIFYL